MIQRTELGRLSAYIKDDYWQFTLNLEDMSEPMLIAKVHMMMVKNPQTREIFQKAIQDVVAVSIQDMTEDSIISISDNVLDH